MELLSRLELPNLFLTKEVLYLLSYNSPSQYINVTTICACCQSKTKPKNKIKPQVQKPEAARDGPPPNSSAKPVLVILFYRKIRFTFLKKRRHSLAMFA